MCIVVSRVRGSMDVECRLNQPKIVFVNAQARSPFHKRDGKHMRPQARPALFGDDALPGWIIRDVASRQVGNF